MHAHASIKYACERVVTVSSVRFLYVSFLYVRILYVSILYVRILYGCRAT